MSLRSLLLLLISSLISLNSYALDSVKITNKSRYTVTVVFASAGCAGVEPVSPYEQKFSCQKKTIAPGETYNYEYPWGTSFHHVILHASTKNDGYHDKRRDIEVSSGTDLTIENSTFGL